ncbi:response regulator [Neobacillus mesonae]|nr:response regulator [Neobacillus mesonae]
MIDVLIVDDDNLVRKGLISAMPWSSFNMRVIGEAGNGEKALEFLGNHKVDLLMTDLAMPVMSGIELIRMVRKLYPDVAISVLTLHQDFEYIQEALRLGAIDYIAKVQLEKERFEEVLSRIHERIVNEQQKQRSHPSVTEYQYSSESAYAILSLENKPLVDNIRQNAAFLDPWKLESDGLILLWKPSDNESNPCNQTHSKEAPPAPNFLIEGKWKMLRITQAQGMMLTELVRLLQHYTKKDLFYDVDLGAQNPMEKSVQQLHALLSESSHDHMDSIKKGLHAFHWIYDDHSFDSLLTQLREARLPIAKLLQLLYGFSLDWNRLFTMYEQTVIALPDTFSCFREVVDWMKSFRDIALELSGRLELSREVSSSILAAVTIVHNELHSSLFALDVAIRVNLSRSYFNQCFKKIVGRSFNEYLRKVRIDKAREYLTQTAKPIVWIAEHTGYADEKYFSKVFREQTGMLPSEYRQQHSQG